MSAAQGVRPRVPPALVVLCLLALPGAWVRPPGLGDVQEIRVYHHPDRTRVVVELSRETAYQAGFLADPPRLFIDLEGTWVETPLRAPRGHGEGAPVVRVRAGQNTVERARVVVELGRAGLEHRVFHLREPFRVVADVYPGEAAPAPPRGVRSVSSTAFDGRPVRVIVIDPGHGGKDPGAISGRVREKDVVLRIARALRTDLLARGFEAHLTREGDRFLTLDERTDRANELGADLFVSIHANASRRQGTHGIETYLLDTHSDRQTARVAARENGSTVAELSELQTVLASLRLGVHERFAARLADAVHETLLGRVRRRFGATPDLGVKRGPFLVLFTAQMPAVLVEVGFLTHRGERIRLASPAFAAVAAEGIASGIVRYRDEHARRLVARR